MVVVVVRPCCSMCVCGCCQTLAPMCGCGSGFVTGNLVGMCGCGWLNWSSCRAWMAAQTSAAAVRHLQLSLQYCWAHTHDDGRIPWMRQWGHNIDIWMLSQTSCIPLSSLRVLTVLSGTSQTSHRPQRILRYPKDLSQTLQTPHRTHRINLHKKSPYIRTFFVQKQNSHKT